MPEGESGSRNDGGSISAEATLKVVGVIIDEVEHLCVGETKILRSKIPERRIEQGD